MADEDSDLVSKIVVEGSEESTKKIEEFADKGAESFEKVADAAKKSGDEIAKSTKDVEETTKKSTSAIKDYGDALKKAAAPAINLAAVTKNFTAEGRKLGTEIRKTAIDLASFVTRLVAIGTAGAAAGAGILKLAQGVAKQVNGTSDAIDRQTKTQIDANNEQLRGISGAINYQSAQRKLFSQLQSGAIDYTQYTASLRQLRTEYREQIRVSAQLAEEQEAVAQANEKLQKQAADRKAYQALTDVYGSVLVGSLVRLGSTVQNTANAFRDSFGPAVAAGLDIVNSVIQRNSAAISGFFSKVSSQLRAFFAQNGPAIEQALTSIGSAAASVFDGLINAAPAILQVFNGVIVPAVTAVYNAIKSFTDAFNSLFGTNLTPAMLVISVILLRLTGGFKLLFSSIGTVTTALTIVKGILGVVDGTAIGFVGTIGRILAVLGPWGIAIGLLVAGLTALYFAVDWTALGATISKFVTDVTTWFTDLGTTIVETVTNWTEAALSPIRTFYETVSGWLTALLDLFRAVGVAGGDGSTPIARAQGGPVGHVRGPGTSTSDSIAAWLSNNEFVVRARAVAKYGVNFLNAINSGRFDPRQMGAYAMGGLVSNVNVPSMSFADGGSVSPALRPFSFQIGSEIFDGLLAPEEVADKLVGYSLRKKTRSAGRIPGWVR